MVTTTADLCSVPLLLVVFIYCWGGGRLLGARGGGVYPWGIRRGEVTTCSTSMALRTKKKKKKRMLLFEHGHAEELRTVAVTEHPTGGFGARCPHQHFGQGDLHNLCESSQN